MERNFATTQVKPGPRANAALKLQGSSCGLIGNFSGGGIFAPVVQEKTGSAYTGKKHIGPVQYDDFSLEIGFGMGQPVFDWIAAAWKHSGQSPAPRMAGSVIALDWEGAIRRWSQDYEFARSNHTASYLDPRGLGTVAAKLSRARWSYAATGAFAAQRFAPIAPARQAALYVEDSALMAERLGLRPADAGANVILAEAFDPVVFERSTAREGLRVVAATQLAADLLTGTGREPSEGDELLGWMHANEDAWRA